MIDLDLQQKGVRIYEKDHDMLKKLHGITDVPMVRLIHSALRTLYKKYYEPDKFIKNNNR